MDQGFPEHFYGEIVLTHRYALHASHARTPLNSTKQFAVGGHERKNYAFNVLKATKPHYGISSYVVACTRFQPLSFEGHLIYVNLRSHSNQQSAKYNVKHKIIGMKTTYHRKLEDRATHK